MALSTRWVKLVRVVKVPAVSDFTLKFGFEKSPLLRLLRCRAGICTRQVLRQLRGKIARRQFAALGRGVGHVDSSYLEHADCACLSKTGVVNRSSSIGTGRSHRAGSAVWRAIEAGGEEKKAVLVIRSQFTSTCPILLESLAPGNSLFTALSNIPEKSGAQVIHWALNSFEVANEEVRITRRVSSAASYLHTCKRFRRDDDANGRCGCKQSCCSHLPGPESGCVLFLLPR